MSTSLIAVRKITSGLYEYFLICGSQQYSHEVGFTSITECLQSAIEYIPESDYFVEISYEGIHLGTYSAKRVRQQAAAAAQLVNDNYASIISEIP